MTLKFLWPVGSWYPFFSVATCESVRQAAIKQRNKMHEKFWYQRSIEFVSLYHRWLWYGVKKRSYAQGCLSCGTCSYLELTEDHVLTSAYVKIFRIVTRNAVNKSFWRKKDCSWPPLNKYAMNIWLSSLRIRAHLSWRTGKHLHVLHVLRTYPTCSYPGYQDTTTYAALGILLLLREMTNLKLTQPVSRWTCHGWTAWPRLPTSPPRSRTSLVAASWPATEKLDISMISLTSVNLR